VSRVFGLVLAALVLAACTPQTPRGAAPQAGTAAAPDRAAAPKRITVAIAGDPHTLYQKLNPSSTVRGVEELEELIYAGFTQTDNRGELRPQLAEAVPTLENGLWKLLPDGRMETSWVIRGDGFWHDGRPVTAQDAVLATTVGQDRDLPVSRHRGYQSVERIEATDARTVTVTWKRAYIEADRTFSTQMGLPLPAHLLEEPYQTDKAGFANLPYWTEEVVGSGPYRMREFVRGSHMVLEANERYVLGTPKIQTIEVKFIPDTNTLVANVLAGTVELVMGRGISLEQGLQARSQWRDGRVDMAVASFLQVFPQLLTPNPAVIGNAQFRRALLLGIDRQEMVDSIQSNVAPVAHIFVSPDEPEYRDIEPAVVKFDFDVRRASQFIEGLGYTKGADGFYRDSAGQRLSVEIRATAGDLNQKAMFAIADYWQRLGVGAEQVAIPPQRASDLEYRSTFPGFNVQRQGGELSFVSNFHSSQARLPENRWAGNNNTRYMNPELDALIDRFETTIPRAERMTVARQAVQHITDQVVELPLFYDAQPALIASRLLNVEGSRGTSHTTWNAHEWDVR
jgi:peptide/nickel transport system substrate-binding protein